MVAIKKIRGILLMILCALLIFMTLLTVRPQVTYACSCIAPAPPLEAMENSDAVFEGTVISIQKPSSLIQSSADPVQVTFQVGSRWKGDPGDQVTLSTARSSESCGFEFTKGERYMVYAREEAAEGKQAKGTLTTSLCSRTALYSAAQEDLNELGAGNGGGSPTALPDIAGNDGTAVPENNPTTAPWILYAEIGLGLVAIIGAALILLRRRTNK